MKKIHALLLAVIVVTSFGCTPSFTLTEKNFQEYKFQVATADKGYSLEMPEVYDDLYRSNLLNLGGVLDTTLVRNYIDSLVFDSLIGFEADEINLSEYYYQYRLYKLRYFDLLLRQFLKKMVYDKAESDSLEIVDYYYANEKLFAIDEQINLYHILLTKNSLLNGPDSLKFRELNEEDLENAVVSLVDSVKSLITSPDKFPEIASQFSEDVGAKKGRGYVGWTKRGKYPDPFDSVAFTLRNGDIGGPYQDDNGWHIIMADEYYPAGLQPINNNLYIAAKNSLQTVKTNKIGNHLIDSLLADYDVVVNKDIADKNVYIVDGQTWGAIINGIDTIDCNEARSLEQSYREKFNVLNTTPEMKAKLFRQLGERYVLIQAARKIGLEEDSAITYQRNKLYHKYARTVVEKNRVDLNWSPSDSLIEKYYNAHLDDFVVNKPLKVQHIIVDDSLLGEFIRDQAMSGVDFMKLAKEYYPGEESIRTELADLGFIGENDVSKDFYAAALKTRVGEVSHPVKTEFGFHLIKVVEIKKNQSVDEARRIILPILKKEHKKNLLKKFNDRLYAKYHVKNVGRLYPVHLKPKSLRK